MTELTPRQTEVLKRIAVGETVKAIFVNCITRENVAKTNFVDYIGFRMPR